MYIQRRIVAWHNSPSRQAVQSWLTLWMSWMSSSLQRHRRGPAGRQGREGWKIVPACHTTGACEDVQLQIETAAVVEVLHHAINHSLAMCVPGQGPPCHLDDARHLHVLEVDDLDGHVLPCSRVDPVHPEAARASLFRLHMAVNSNDSHCSRGLAGGALTESPFHAQRRLTLHTRLQRSHAQCIAAAHTWTDPRASRWRGTQLWPPACPGSVHYSAPYGSGSRWPGFHGVGCAPISKCACSHAWEAVQRPTVCVGGQCRKVCQSPRVMLK